MRWAALCGVLAWALALAAAATELPAPLIDGGTAMVVEVVDGDTVVLADGRQVRIVGIQAPKLPLGRPDFEPWPLADGAKAALEALALGRRVTLGYGGRREDRYGRALAHLYLDDGTWLQGAMLGRGLARVYTFDDNRALIPELLTREQMARTTARGIWTHPYYALLDPAGAPAHVGRFALVEGRIVYAATVRGRGYLNFGPDYRTDFTISIAPGDMRRFRADGITVDDYEGRRVRVRGWLRSLNGPMIDVTHPEQIEVLVE